MSLTCMPELEKPQNRKKQQNNPLRALLLNERHGIGFVPRAHIIRRGVRNHKQWMDDPKAIFFLEHAVRRLWSLVRPC